MNCGSNYLRKDGEATVLHLMPRRVPNPGRTFMQWDWHLRMMHRGTDSLRKDGEAAMLYFMPRGVPNPGRMFMKRTTDVICLTCKFSLLILCWVRSLDSLSSFLCSQRNHWMLHLRDLKLIRKGGDYYVIRGDYIHKYVPSGEGAKLPPGYGDRKKIDSASLMEDEWVRAGTTYMLCS